MIHQGPITYQGNKRRLMPQIKPLLRPTDVFVDLFCGSGTVGLNAPAETVILNDLSRPVVDLLKFLAKTDYDEIYKSVEAIAERYDLTFGARGTLSKEEVADHNRSGYVKMRDDYNRSSSPELLLALVLYGFNKQIRFNKQGKFNNPPGDNDFNLNAQKKIKDYQQRASELKLRFLSWDFRDWRHFHYPRQVMFYADPPYLISDATYNAGWKEDSERDLLALLDAKHEEGDLFALSNVVESNGKVNKLLLEWVESNPEYQVHEIDSNYNSSNYQRKNSGLTREILVTNY